MTEAIKALAMRMVNEYAEKEWQLNYEYVVKTAYLSGFEARDGMDDTHLLTLLHTQVTKRAHDQNAHPTNTEAIWQRYCEENGIKL